MHWEITHLTFQPQSSGQWFDVYLHDYSYCTYPSVPTQKPCPVPSLPAINGTIMQTHLCCCLDKHYTVFLCESDRPIGMLYHFLGAYGAWVVWLLVDAEYGLCSNANRSCINKESDVITGAICLNWSMITLMDQLLKHSGYCSFAISHWAFNQTVQLTVTILSVMKNSFNMKTSFQM